LTSAKRKRTILIGGGKKKPTGSARSKGRPIGRKSIIGDRKAELRAAREKKGHQKKGGKTQRKTGEGIGSSVVPPPPNWRRGRFVNGDAQERPRRNKRPW